MKTLGAAILLAGLLLSGCTQYSERPGASAVELGRYVAMGSSMAAGPGLGQIKPGTPERCTRTFANYPTLLAERLKLTLVDATCSGATTEHVLRPWDDLPAQIDAVTPDTTLVTLTIGGNDLNYIGALMASGCDEKAKATFQGQTIDCPSARQPTEVDYAIVEKNLNEIARQVKQRAPQAHLIFVQYLQLVPGALCDATPISEARAASARATAQRLADITENIARENGSLLLLAHDWSAQNTPCGDLPYVNGNPAGYDMSNGMIWHPNFAGMAAIADWAEYVLGE